MKKAVVKSVLAIVLVVLGLVLAQAQTAPVLVIPHNGDTLSTNYPTFIWTPVSTPNASYVLLLTEQLPFQTPVSAVLSNPIFFQTSTGSQTMYQYGLSAPTLQPNKCYAWQVRVYLGEGQPILSSEPANFYTKPPPPTPLPPKVYTRQFIIPNAAHSRILRHTVEGDTLFFMAEASPSDSELRFVIYDSTQKAVAASINNNQPAHNASSVQQANAIPLVQGRNYCKLPMNKLKLSQNSLYLFEYACSNNQKYFFYFTRTVSTQ